MMNLEFTGAQECELNDGLRALLGISNLIVPVGVGDSADSLETISRCQLAALIRMTHDKLLATLRAAGYEYID